MFIPVILSYFLTSLQCWYRREHVLAGNAKTGVWINTYELVWSSSHIWARIHFHTFVSQRAASSADKSKNCKLKVHTVASSCVPTRALPAVRTRSARTPCALRPRKMLSTATLEYPVTRMHSGCTLLSLVDSLPLAFPITARRR
jgi:hypothetical protein